ncbi:MAG: hypothetical protein ACO29O_05810 [Chitinophagaceae bacterium]
MKLSPSLIILSACLSLVSCQKEMVATVEDVTESIKSDLNVQVQYDDVFENVVGISSTAAGEDLGLFGSFGAGIFQSAAGITTEQSAIDCGTLTITPATVGVFPKTVVIDFGTGCTKGSRIRKGKIITVYTGPLKEIGSKATTTFEGFYIDTFKIEGTHIVQNTSDRLTNTRQLTREIQNGKVSNVNTNLWVQINEARIITQSSGSDTPLNPLDDVFQAVFDRSALNNLGKTWSAKTISPLIRPLVCEFITKGTIELKWGSKTGTIDFGDGTCDDLATISSGLITKTINLK